MTYAIASIALAVCAIFLHPAIIVVIKEIGNRRRQRNIEQIQKDLYEACATGNAARICILRKRLQELISE